MNSYELTLVLPGKSKSKEKTIKEKVEKLVETVKGKVKKADSWGELDLAYLVNKEKSGYFLHFQLELGGDSVKKLDDKLRTEDDVIRYLLIRN